MPKNIHLNKNIISSYSKHQTKKENNLQRITLTQDSKYNKIIESKRQYINDLYRHKSNEHENEPQRQERN